MPRSLASFLPSLLFFGSSKWDTLRLGEGDRIIFYFFLSFFLFFFSFFWGGGITWLSVETEEGYWGGVKEIREAMCLTPENYWYSSIRRDCSSGQNFLTSLCAKRESLKKSMCSRPNNYQTKTTLQSLARGSALLELVCVQISFILTNNDHNDLRTRIYPTIRSYCFLQDSL